MSEVKQKSRVLLIRISEEQYKYLHDKSYQERQNKSTIIRNLIDKERGV